MSVRSASVWLSALLVAGCSSDRSAGGGGFEGEAITVAGTVNHGGSPLAGARIAWFDPTLDRVLDSTLSGPDGSFSLTLDHDKSGWIEVRSGDSALERRVVEHPGATALSLRTITPAIWTGIVTRAGTAVPGARIRIWGSTSEVVAGPDGSVRLEHAPDRGEWVSLQLPDGSRTDRRLPLATESSLEVPQGPAILLDDFESSGTQSALASALGSGWWFALTDSLSGGASKALPAGVIQSFRLAYDTLTSWDRTSLSVGFHIDPAQSVRYGVVGVEMASSGRWVDLSTMDSLTFMARGSGTFKLEFFTEAGMLPDADPNGQFRVFVTPSPTWTRMVIRRDQILAPAGSRAQNAGIPWSLASTRCRRLAFLASDTASLQLDDMVLHGPSLRELFPRP